ncbi:MAG TPA: paraquat-inducible protein A [Pseudomonadales bacterium]|nr:paraquat-inducible protein A [Pseudomonadales bacterium]
MTDSRQGDMVHPAPVHMTACAECDLLLEDVEVPAGDKSACPRCGHVLKEGAPDSVIQALVLSTIGLIMFGPALGLPLLSLSAAGLRHDVSLGQAILSLGDSGFWEVATMVAVVAVVAPLLNLWLMFTVSLMLQIRSHSRWLPTLLRINHTMQEWAMPEVFVMGILVSAVKLKDLAHLLPAVGLYGFICMMLCILLLNTIIDQHELWHVYEINRSYPAATSSQ